MGSPIQYAYRYKEHNNIVLCIAATVTFFFAIMETISEIKSNVFGGTGY